MLLKTFAGLALLLMPVVANAETRGDKLRAENARLQTSQKHAKLPLSFEPNVGQTHSDVRFVSRAPGYSLFLTATEAVLSFKSATPLRMQWIGANPRAVIAGAQALPGKSNYYRGKNPREWRTDVPQFAEVRYTNLYSGIDLVYYGTQEGRIEYDLVVAPGVDPGAISLGIDGFENLEIDGDGNLVVALSVAPSTTPSTVMLQRPTIYQSVNGTRKDIAGRYVRKGNRVGFHVASYDRSLPLVIDPVLALAYSTFLGGSGDEKADAIAVDAAGNAVIMGSTGSLDFPTANAAQPTAPGGDDHFVAKLNASGSALVYATYLGGTEGEGVNLGAIALDGAGNAYVAASTQSADFPTTVGAYQTALNNPGQGFGSFDGYIVKLSPTGGLVYSTLLGGNFWDAVYAIAVDSGGNAYVTGNTLSNDFPLMNPMKSTTVSEDTFVTKLNSAGSALVYSTYLGGDGGFDIAGGIAVDSAGSTYVTGFTGAPDFPVANAVQPSIDSTLCFPSVRCGDAFVAKINPAGSAFVYSTFLGGNHHDRGNDIGVDPSGAAYVVGDTVSTNFPTANPLQATNAGAVDMFVAKFSPSGSTLVYSTYLGGSGQDGAGFGNAHIVGLGIAVDAAGDVYLAGVTTSPDFPAVSHFQSFMAGGGGEAQAFVAKLNAAGSALTYSTAMNPPIQVAGADIGIDLIGNAYITGGAAQAGGLGAYPTTPGAFQPVHAGGSGDGFVTKITHFITVTIDIKPNSSPNTINLGSNGVTSVAILSTTTFDATTVDPRTVTLASAPVKLKGNGTPQANVQDVNGDGRQDLVVHVETEAFALSETDTQAVLEGETFGGTAIVGTDYIRIVP